MTTVRTDLEDMEISKGIREDADIAQGSKDNLGAGGELDVDRGWAWVVLVASFLSCFLTGGICFSFGVYYAAYIDIFPKDPLTIAFLTSIPGSFILLVGPLSQYFSKKLGYMWTLLIGSLLASLGFVFSYLTYNLYVLLFTQGLMVGIGSGLIFTPAISVLRLCFVRKYLWTGALGISGSALGCLVFPTLIVRLIRFYGIQGSFLIMGGIMLHVSVCALLLYRLPPLITKGPILFKQPGPQGGETRTRGSTRGSDSSASSTAESTGLRGFNRNDDATDVTMARAQRSEVSNPKSDGNPLMVVASIQNVTFLASSGFWQMASNVIYFMIANFGITVGGLDRLKSSTLISWIGTGDLCGRLVITAFGLYLMVIRGQPVRGDSAGGSQNLGKGESGPLYKALGYHGTLVMHTVVCLAYLVPRRVLTYGYMSILAFLFGVGFGLRISLASNVVGDLFGAAKFFTAYGLFMMFCGVGGLLGTPLATWMTVYFDNPVVMFYLTPTVFALSEILLVLSTWHALRIQFNHRRRRAP